MGLFDWFTGDVLDDALGFVDEPSTSIPSAQPAVATTEPATNTPTPTPAQITSYDRTQSYLNAQAQKAYISQLRQLTGAAVSEPPTFSQTIQGQKMIKFGIVAAIAWLFLFKGK